MRDEFLAMKLPDAAGVARHALLFEEFIDREIAAGRMTLALNPLPVPEAVLHGHCHQKAFDAMGPVERVLRRVPSLAVRTVASGCCGMAGAFGYEAEHFETSVAMAELSLLPAVRAAAPEALIVADGTSCRHQILDGSGRRALHVAEVLDRSLNGSTLGHAPVRHEP